MVIRINQSFLIKIFKERGGILTTSELNTLGILKSEISRLCKKEVIEAICKGVYRHCELPVSRYHDFIAISKKTKNPVICLISALDFHNLTLQIPHVIYVALAKNAYRPKISYPPIEYFTYPDEVLNTGTIIIKEPGWSIRIFDKEKTLIDCLIFERLLDDEIIDDAFSKYMRFPPKNYLKKLEKYAEQFGVLPQLHERLNKSMCC